MRKLLILLLSIFLSLNLMAQLEVKEGSFKEVDGFVNINTEIMYDDNDKPYAVLKVKTENINDKERHQLLFQGDARTFFELEYKVGEVWVYLSYYASYLKISHPDFGSTEFWFPFDMYGKKGYELTLINKPSLEEDFMKRLEALENATAAGLNTGEYGYVVIKTTPVNGATILIDGEEKEMKTPFVSDKLSVGPHRIRVVKEHYKPYVTVVEIEEGKTKNIDVEMKQAYGNLEIVTQPENANIKINRIDKGTTPKTFDNIQAGDYKIELSKKKYQTVVKDVTVKDGDNTLVEVEMERIPKAQSLRKKGWVLRPEIGVGVLENAIVRWFIYNNTNGNYEGYRDCLYVVVNANVGYQINPYVYLGFGIGADLKAKSMISLPLYVNPRFYVNNRKTGLFFDIKMGCAISLKSSDVKYIYQYSHTSNDISSVTKFDGFMGVVEIGFEYKHSGFGVSIGAQNFYSEFHLFDYNKYHSDYPLYYMLTYGYSIFWNKK
ncbi:MAG: PEGA domain-containing protein [Bacteroidales bacterium]|nr:PEGA domain-containing protein [Bacteroidales bacterium]